MSNIFANATRSVNTYNCIQKDLNEFDKRSEAVAACESFKNLKNKAAIEQAKIADAKKEEMSKKSSINEAIVKNSLTEGNIIRATNDILEECQTKLFKHILTEYYVNSLCLDRDFVVEHLDIFKNMVSKYVDDNGGFNIVKEAVAKNPDSILLKKLYEACDKTAKKVSNRKFAEMTESKSDENTNTKLNDDEKKEFFDNKDTLDVERISQLVKDKVITVIKDEKKRQEKEDEIVTEIEDELKNDENVKDEKSVDEGLERIVINRTPFEEATLFNSLLRSSYEDIMAENIAIQSDVHKNYQDDHDSELYDVDQTLDELNDDESEDSVTNDENPEATDINDELAMENSTVVNMDHVFADAIANYTLMETLYTLKLENYTKESIERITQQIVNPVVESGKSADSETFTKVRADFFKIFNKFKDLKDIEKTKEEIKKFVDNCGGDEERSRACDVQIKTGIAQLVDITEKNPNLKDKYQEIIDWCHDELE